MSLDYLRWRAIDVLSRSLPLRAGYALGGLLSRLLYATDPRGRAAMACNHRRILADQGRSPSASMLAAMGRETYRNFAKYLVEFFGLGKKSRAALEEFVTIENGQLLAEAMGKGRGVVALTAHLGNWEVAGQAAMALGYTMHGVFFPMRDQRTAALFEKRRRARGGKPILFGRAAARVMQLLRQGEMVGLLADVDFSLADDFVDFFGAPARLPAGPARMALKTGAIILPGFALRKPDNTFIFRWHPPIDPVEVGTLQDVRERIRLVLEKEIREHPTQWMVFVDMWDHEETRRLAVAGVG